MWMDKLSVVVDLSRKVRVALIRGLEYHLLLAVSAAITPLDSAPD